MTILLIDIGNSCAKLVDYSKEKGFDAIKRVDNKELHSVDEYQYDTLCISNVGVDDSLDMLMNRFTMAGKRVWVCDVNPKRDGLSTKYNVQKLGIDRWLALLAAHRKSEADYVQVIIDAGSAITVDVISHDGTHLGGQIIAGKPLLRKALQTPVKMRNDKEIDIIQNDLADVDLPIGVNTAECVQYGIRTSLSGVVLLLQRIEQHSPKPMKVWFTGGDGIEIMSMCEQMKTTKSPMEYDAYLVFRGMLVQLRAKDLLK